MPCSNRNPNVLLYIWNWINILQYREEPLWYLCWRKSSQTISAICCCHLCFLNSKIIFWPIIWRLHQTKWRNRNQLLGIHEEDSSNNSLEAFMVVVSSSSLHWCDAYLSTLEMVNQKIKANSIWPTNWYRYYLPSNRTFGQIFCWVVYFGWVTGGISSGITRKLHIK